MQLARIEMLLFFFLAGFEQRNNRNNRQYTIQWIFVCLGEAIKRERAAFVSQSLSIQHRALSSLPVNPHTQLQT